MTSLVTIVTIVLFVTRLGWADEAQCAAKQDCFPTKYDAVKMDIVVASDPLLKTYVDCLLDRGNCTQEALLLRDLIPDAFLSECSKCTEYQKEQVAKLFSYMLQFKRPWFEELVEKFDATGLYKKKHEFGEDEDYEYEQDDKTEPTDETKISSK